MTPEPDDLVERMRRARLAVQACEARVHTAKVELRQADAEFRKLESEWLNPKPMPLFEGKSDDLASEDRPARPDPLPSGPATADALPGPDGDGGGRGAGSGPAEPRHPARQRGTGGDPEREPGRDRSFWAVGHPGKPAVYYLRAATVDHANAWVERNHPAGHGLIVSWQNPSMVPAGAWVRDTEQGDQVLPGQPASTVGHGLGVRGVSETQANATAAVEDETLLCPPDLESATGYFDPTGYDPQDCAGCGAPRAEHVSCEPGSRPLSPDSFSSDLRWLTNCPTGDSNFRGAVHRAELECLKTALDRKITKAARKAIDAEIRRREKTATKETATIERGRKALRRAIKSEGRAEQAKLEAAS